MVGHACDTHTHTHTTAIVHACLYLCMRRSPTRRTVCVYACLCGSPYSGVNAPSIEHGSPNLTLFSPVHDITPEQDKTVNKMIDSVYDDFLGKVCVCVCVCVCVRVYVRPLTKFVSQLSVTAGQ